MALPSWANDTIARLRPHVTLVRGSEILDWTDPDALEITGCSMQPAGTSLSQDGRVLGIEGRYTCFLPLGSDVQEGDRIVFGDATYTITGAPQVWKSPTGLVSNIQLPLERWAG